MELSKLNLKDISIHFSKQDFENFIEPVNLLTQFLNDNKVVISEDVNIHLGHKRDLTDNDSLFYQLKRIFPNNTIYWWNLMGHDFRNLMLNNFSKFDKSLCCSFFIFPNVEDKDPTAFKTNSKNLPLEFEICKELNIPTILIKNNK